MYQDQQIPKPSIPETKGFFESIYDTDDVGGVEDTTDPPLPNGAVNDSDHAIVIAVQFINDVTKRSVNEDKLAPSPCSFGVGIDLLDTADLTVLIMNALIVM